VPVVSIQPTPAPNPLVRPPPPSPAQALEPVARTVPRGVTWATPTLSFAPSHAYDCVAFLTQDLHIKLPGGLYSFSDKENIINVTGAPHVGDVAVIRVDSGQYVADGHLAVVTAITDNSLTITEADYGGDTVDQRTSTGTNILDAESELNIVGFYRDTDPGTQPVPPKPPVPAPPIVRPSVAPAKSLTDALAVCNKESEGQFTLQGAGGDIKLDRCYRGTDHLNCKINALVAEARDINQSYKEIADPRYADISNIDAICRIEPGILADHLKRAKSFDSRWDILSAEYAKLADCSTSVEESIRNVVLPDLSHGGDIVKSMIEKIRGAVNRVSESQKEVGALSVEVDASRKALTAFQKIRNNGGMCSRKPN